MTLKKIAIIPARSGSKGLPNKNILMLLEKPLIAYTIEAALKSDLFDRVIVSTDSLEYKAIAEQYGAEVILRDEELASDTASSFMVIQDVLKKTAYIGSDYFALLQPTSPFRSRKHITEAIDLFEAKGDINFLVSMVESEKSADLIKPLGKESSLKNFDSDYSNYRRQNCKEYTPNGAIFIGNNIEYLTKKHFFGSDSIAFVMNKMDSIDIDDQLDFELAIAIAAKKQKKEILLSAINNRIQSKVEYMSIPKPITLIGHSIFDNWNVKELCGIPVNNLGIAGISSKEYIELILDKGLLENIGEHVFLLAGTNDMVIDNWNKQDTLNWIKIIFDKIISINSNAKVSLIEVPKVRGRIDRSNKVISELNEYLKTELASDLNWVELGEYFIDDFGNLNEEFTYDGLHFTELAYKKLTMVLEKQL